MGLLCACIVRRLYDLRRVLPFVFFFSPLALSFSPFVLLLSCFPAWLLFLVLSFLSLWVVVVSFSLSDYAQKREGAPCWCVLSCPVVGLFPLSYYLDSTAGDEIFHACHIVNWYIMMIKTISSIIEANKRKI